MNIRKRIAAAVGALVISASGVGCAVPAEDSPEFTKPDSENTQQDSDNDQTTAQEQATQSAKGYLDMGGFSRSGLIEQLEFEGFTTDTATTAVDSLDTNWREQAVKSAEGYVDLGGFSRESLIGQLEFEGFTRDQAEYAASEVGL